MDVQALDADVLVGHNLAAFDLTVLLSRMQHHKVGRGMGRRGFGGSGMGALLKGGAVVLGAGWWCGVQELGVVGCNSTGCTPGQGALPGGEPRWCGGAGVCARQLPGWGGRGMGAGGCTADLVFMLALFTVVLVPQGPSQKTPPLVVLVLPGLRTARACLCPQVPLWSRIGRVKKTEFPKLTGGGHTFGGGAGPGVMSTVAGALPHGCWGSPDDARPERASYWDGGSCCLAARSHHPPCLTGTSMLGCRG